ncbi:MAG: HEAT repeat domain-containing protein, partial [Planctomycetota bacterium]
MFKHAVITILCVAVLPSAWPCLAEQEQTEVQLDNLLLTICIKQLKSPNAKVRSSAAEALANRAVAVPEAASALIAALKDDDWAVRMRAAQGLGWIGPVTKGVVPALIGALKDKHDAVRTRAARALGNIGPDAAEARPALTEALGGKDWIAWAAWALSQTRPEVKEWVERSIKVLEDIGEARRDSAKFSNAISTVGYFGPAAREAIPALIRLLREAEDMYVLRFAASTLDMGPAAKKAVPELMKALKRSEIDALALGAVVRTLGRIDLAANEAVPALIYVLARCKDSNVRSWAAWALGTIARRANRAVPAFLEALKDEDP